MVLSIRLFLPLLWQVIVLFRFSQMCPPPPISFPRLCMRVCLFFFSRMFSGMSASNNREMILTEARGCCDWKGHVLHSQITGTLPSNRCSPGARPRMLQLIASHCDKGINQRGRRDLGKQKSCSYLDAFCLFFFFNLISLFYVLNRLPVEKLANNYC